MFAILITQISIGQKQYKMTPSRVMATKRIARRSYTSFSQTFAKLHSVKIIKALGDIIKNEFKNICSDHYKSILKGGAESIKSFNWEKENVVRDAAEDAYISIFAD